jgi:hypothetical protein
MADTTNMTDTEKKEYEKTKKRVKFSFISAAMKGIKKDGKKGDPKDAKKTKYRKARLNEE